VPTHFVSATLLIISQGFDQILNIFFVRIVFESTPKPIYHLPPSYTTSSVRQFIEVLKPVSHGLAMIERGQRDLANWVNNQFYCC
jgi:hypothetical protein